MIEETTLGERMPDGFGRLADAWDHVHGELVSHEDGETSRDALAIVAALLVVASGIDDIPPS